MPKKSKPDNVSELADAVLAEDEEEEQEQQDQEEQGDQETEESEASVDEAPSENPDPALEFPYQAEFEDLAIPADTSDTESSDSDDPSAISDEVIAAAEADIAALSPFPYSLPRKFFALSVPELIAQINTWEISPKLDVTATGWYAVNELREYLAYLHYCGIRGFHPSQWKNFELFIGWRYAEFDAISTVQPS